ncbi:MAG: tRNA (adenosine(37)-N6)-threonylcarbamoyltransferase complex ATPase subunit type 1 TsaE [Phycisphaeraceae bacterium]|nr:MAG: tRNA (adenosine(37)-N6)-threonylcarbamoyltransferase complex ATPase subunit type 1 TsaE [Phycisphaeraceae bacterium]
MAVVVRELSTPALTEALARGVADALEPGDVVALSGDLGAGKTFFARAVAAALGVDPGVISSPTYVIVNQYPVTPRRAGGDAGAGARTESGGRTGVEVVHADFYRLGGEDDLPALGWDRLVGPRSIVLVEWPERAPAALGDPSRVACVAFEATGPESRRATLTLPEAWHGRPAYQRLIDHPPTVCAVSGRAVSPTNPAYPFADERSRLADLNRWFTGSYTTSRPAEPADFEDDAGS